MEGGKRLSGKKKSKEKGNIKKRQSGNRHSPFSQAKNNFFRGEGQGKAEGKSRTEQGTKTLGAKGNYQLPEEKKRELKQEIKKES